MQARGQYSIQCAHSLRANGIVLQSLPSHFHSETNRSETTNRFSELCLGRGGVFFNQPFNFSELVVKLEALLVRQRVRRLDDLATHNLLNRKLDFLEVDSRLRIDKLAVGSRAIQTKVRTYRYLRRLEDILRHAAPPDIL